MELRNESVGGYPMMPIIGGGYGNCGYGGGGILTLLAALALFNKDFSHGNWNSAQANLGFIETALGNIRADIGDTKYDTVSSILQQTSSLMAELCNGRMENIQAIMNQTNALQCSLNGLEKEIHCGNSLLGAQVAETKYDLSSKIDCGNNHLAQSILTMGYKNELANCQQTNLLSRQLSDCCCETKQLVQGTAFETQLRDLQNQNSTNQQLAELKCLIKETAKDQEIERLKRAENQGFIAHEIDRGISAAIGATLGHWAADAQVGGPEYPTPSVPIYQFGAKPRSY